jgi:hypothetical protein
MGPGDYVCRYHFAESAHGGAKIRSHLSKGVC